jgi:hypothetical protein
MALLQLNVALGSSRLHHLIAGTPFPFVFGLGAVLGRSLQPSEVHFLSGPSLHSQVTTLVNLGAIGYRCHLRE